MDSLKGSAGTVGVRVESEPAGAEAKGPTGSACRTPCTLQLPVSGMTSVSLALAGYQPQSVPVSVTTIRAGNEFSETGSPSESVQIDPNPVYTILQPAPPPPPVHAKKPPPKTKPKPRPQAQAPQVEQPPPAPAPAAQQQQPQQPGAPRGWR